ncbi:MAG: hypothetical protein M3619_17335, partial [Myxococcota bacterium]|nr:hypothetical protein [Myxococcota bacterium]
MHRLGTGVLVVLVGCVTGCSSILGIDDFKLGDAGTTSGDILSEGAPVDAPANCLGPAGFVVCLEPLPTTPIDFNNSATSNINTDSSPLCLATQPPSWKAASQPDTCFIVATTIMFNAPTRVVGSRPIAFVATEAIYVGADIDVASHRGSLGAAGNSPACVVPPPGVSSTGGAGAGAGGSFMTPGGGGGAGTSAPGAGAVGPDAAQPTKLRGGCSGSRGGQGQSTAAIAGSGGGAIYLLAGFRIAVEAAINASGAGGEPPGIVGGGAGGGSGGMI